MLPRASIAMVVRLWLADSGSPMGESWVGVGSGIAVVIGDKVSCGMRLDGVRMSGEYKSESSPGGLTTWLSLISIDRQAGWGHGWPISLRGCPF
jgi:hypothetical protein